MHDNVIPASNSQMAKNLYMLSKITGNETYETITTKMLAHITNEMESYPSGHSNWASLALCKVFAFHEVCIVGKAVDEYIKEFKEYYIPNAIFVYSKTSPDIALLKDRFKPDETLIYICRNNTCSAPVKTIEEALKLLN